MNKIISVVKDVEVHPKFLNTQIKEYIKSNLSSQKICSQNYGYITEIKDITKLESVGISSVTKFPIFRISFIAETIFPEPQQLIFCKITMIFHQGIFMEKGPIKILVPMTNIKGYIFDKETKTFSNDERTLKVGDSIEIKIKDIRYEKQAFNCIATLP